jgi:diguanylate cyclase (GGDEF)-like protein
LNIASVGALVYLIVVLAPKRHIPASKAFLVLAGVLIVWMIVLINQVTISFSETQVIFLHRLNKSVFLFIPPALVFLVDKYATITRIMKRWVIFVIGIVILLLLAVIWTNQFHHLYWQTETVVIYANRLQILTENTFLAQSILVMQHLVISFSIYLLLNLTVQMNPVYRRITNIINISLLSTAVFSGVILLIPDTIPYNLLPVALTATSFSLAYLLVEHNIFDLAVISRITYFHELADGAIVTSITGTILDVNKVIEERIGHESVVKMIGNDVLEKFPQWKEAFQRTLETHEDQNARISFSQDGNETQYDITMHPNTDMYGFVSTILIKFSDVTFYRQLLEQVNELAIRDPLTGILNRRHFELLVTDHLKLAQRYQRNGCLVMFDLDDFKHINDFYGHQLGDKVLSDFCRQMNALLRESDIFARYGGDEFVIYFPETNIDGAMRAINNFQKFILGTTIEIEEEIIPIKFSVGVVPISARTVNLPYEELIQRADQAMYAAKNDSPNAVGIHEGEQINFRYLALELPQRQD